MNNLLVVALLGAVGQVASQSVLKTGDRSLCVVCNQYWKVIPTEESKAISFEAIRAEPLGGGCADVNSSAAVTNGGDFAGKAVAFRRGNCTFAAMAEAAEAHGAVGVLVLNSDDRSMQAGWGLTNVSGYDAFPHPVCMVGYDDSAVVANGGTFELWSDPYAPLDWSAIGFLILAIGSILTGSFLGTEAERHRAFGPLPDGTVSAADADAARSPGDLEPPQELTTRKIVMFVGFASTFLVIMYFLFDYLVYVLIGVFALFGSLSVYELLADAVSRTSLWKHQTDAIPRCPNTPLVSVGLIVVCVGMAAVWVAERHASFAWILQDIMGVAVLITIVKLVAIPNLRMASLMLSLLLLYDVFFVFITPLLTSKKESIMVHAATGSQTRQDTEGCVHPKEMMPFLLQIPRLVTPLCQCARKSMLGFGDVVFPGWLVALCLRCDCYRAIVAPAGAPKPGRFSRYSYTIVGAISYCVGLSMAFVAAGFMDTAQPALLYLTPCTLVAVWTTGWWHGHLPVLKDLSNAMKEAMEGGGPGINSTSGTRSPLVPRQSIRERKRAGTHDGDEDTVVLLGGGD